MPGLSVTPNIVALDSFQFTPESDAVADFTNRLGEPTVEFREIKGGTSIVTGAPVLLGYYVSVKCKILNFGTEDIEDWINLYGKKGILRLNYKSGEKSTHTDFECYPKFNYPVDGQTTLAQEIEFNKVITPAGIIEFVPAPPAPFNVYSSYYDGLTSYATPGSHTALDITDNLTAVAVFKCESSTPSTAGHIISKYQDTTSDRSVFIAQYTTANTIIIRLSSNGTTAAKDYRYTFADITQWHTVAIRFTGGVLSVFADGIDVTANCTKTTDTSLTTLYNSGGPWAFGCNNVVTTKSNFFKGWIKDIKLFNIALTDAQIFSLYNDSIPADVSGMTGMQGWWRFENNGNDSSPNGFTLTTSASAAREMMVFNGTSSYLECANASALQITSALSCIVWLKLDSSTPSGNKHIIGKWNTVSGSWRSWRIAKTTTANQYVFMLDGTGTGNATYAKQYRFTVTDATALNQIAFTWSSASGLKVYWNGTDVTASCTKTSDGTVTSLYNPTSQPVTAGVGSTGDADYMAGRISQFTITNTVLAAADILADYTGYPHDGHADTGVQLFVNGTDNISDLSSNAIAITNHSVVLSDPVTLYQATIPTKTTFIGQDQTQNDFDNTKIKEGIYRKSPFSEVVFTTTDTTLTLAGYCENYGETTAEILLYVNGTYTDRMQFSAAGYAEKKFTGLASGSKTITLRNGGHEWVSPGRGTFVTRVFANIEPVQVTRSKPRLIIVGDSIANGKAGTIPVRDGWVSLVKAYATGYNVALYGGSGMQFKDVISDSTKRADLIATIGDHMDSTTSNVIAFCLDTNDYGKAQWTASAYQTALTEFYNALKTAYPTLTVWHFSGTVRTTETANAVGSTMDNYRDAGSNAIAAVSGYHYQSRKTWITTGALADYVHPNTSGHVTIATQTESALGL